MIVIPNLQAYITLVLGTQIIGWAVWVWGNIPVGSYTPSQQRWILNPLYSVFIGASSAAGTLLGVMWASITLEFAWGGVLVMNAGILAYATILLQEKLESAGQTC